MPNFCRHNRFVQNCPICSREQEVELRGVITPGGSGPSRPRQRTARHAVSAQRPSGMRVRRLERGAEDGFHSKLVPGIKSSVDAQRLAEELAFAARRLHRLAENPPGLYKAVAGRGDTGAGAADAAGAAGIEERSWLAFLIAYLGPLDGEDPFVELRARRTSWAGGADPDLGGLRTGPRGAHDGSRAGRTIDAYRQWALRAGSQAAAYKGEAGWSAERRFARAYERLGLPGLHRDARFDLLVTLGSLGVYELRADALHLGGANEVTLAAKRALGIGDPLLLERRAAELGGACGLPLEALDVGLYNWGRGARASLGLEPDEEPDAEALRAARSALGL